MNIAINLANDFQPQARDVEIKVLVNNESFQRAFGEKRLSIEKNLVAQAMSNILENAVKYADPGTTITVSGRGDDKSVGIVIENIGIPISDEEKHRLFERHYRGRAAMQKVAAGTGIGLYLASRVMAFHGGRIDVENREKLSIFSLMFSRERLI